MLKKLFAPIDRSVEHKLWSQNILWQVIFNFNNTIYLYSIEKIKQTKTQNQQCLAHIKNSDVRIIVPITAVTL